MRNIEEINKANVKKIASTKKPVIVSTGGVSEKDLETLIYVAANSPFSLFSPVNVS